MPAFYAHKRFGWMVLKAIGGETATVCEANRAAFELGLQGPDFLFYYQPWHRNAVAAYGVRLHQERAQLFFEQGIRTFRAWSETVDGNGFSQGVESDQPGFRQAAASAFKKPDGVLHGKAGAASAYFFGAFCHFVLDSSCHPYVNAFAQKSGVGHLEIEEEFEKFLLRRDGKPVFSFAASEDISLSPEIACAAAVFYPELTLRQTREAIASFRRYKRLLTAPDPLRQWLVNCILHIGGRYHEYNGLMLQRRDNPACRESNEVLWRKMQAAVSLACELSVKLKNSLRTGAALPAYFDQNFEGNGPITGDSFTKT